MNFTFYTDEIDERLYKRAINYFVYITLGKKLPNYIGVLRDWDVEIYPSTFAKGVPNFDGNPRGIGGVTGLGIIKLYVNDSKDDTFMFLENFLMISHELCHMIGIILGWNERVPLRNDDWSGNKAGTKLNRYVQEVHDRHIEGKLFTMKMWAWHKFWKIYNLRVLDIRDLIEQ